MASKTPDVAHGVTVGGTFDVVSPYFSIATIIGFSASLFGSRATTLCAYHALDAHHAGRDGDYRLWLMAFKHHQLRNQPTS